jgi:hypothetical protein
LMLAAGYPKALIPFHVPNNITCLCVSPLSFHMEILLYQHGKSALDTSRTLFLLASNQGASSTWYMYMFSLIPPARFFVYLFVHFSSLYICEYVCVRLCAYVHIFLFLPECACSTIIDTSHHEYLVWCIVVVYQSYLLIVYALLGPWFG